MPSKLYLGLGTALNAIGSIGPQLAALLLLSGADFGRFSVVYLTYAFAVSLSLSIVCEPWARGVARSQNPQALGYGTAALCISGGLGALVLGGGLLAAETVGGALLAGLAVQASALRSTMRYLQVHQKQWKRSLLGDMLFVVVFSSTLWICSMTDLERFVGITCSWASAAIAANLVDLSALFQSRGDLRGWLRSYAPDIKPLLGESLLMDLGAIFAPFLLLPRLGLDGFGVYRAVSNVGAPVRLILNPLRALIGRQAPSLKRLGDWRSLVILGGALAIGGAGSTCLILIGNSGMSFGVLSDLAQHWVPVGVFLSAQFIGHYSYIRCRSMATAKMIFRGRFVQTSLMLVLPLAGAFIGGVPFAIWGLGAATSVSALVWTAVDNEFGQRVRADTEVQ